MDQHYLMDVLKELKTGLNGAEEKDEILKWLSDINLIFVPNTCKHSTQIQVLSCGEEDILEVKRLVKTSTFATKQILDLIIQKLTVDWISKVKNENFNKFVKPLFVNGPADDAFLALTQSIESLGKDFRFNMCVSLLEEMVTVERLTELLQSQCTNPCGLSSAGQSAIGGNIGNSYSDQLIVGLVSLPEKMANRLQHDNSDKFYPAHYIPLLSQAVLQTLEHSHASLTSLTGGQDVNLQMVTGLVGKLCVTGHADLFLKTVLPCLCARVREDFAWGRICARVFTGVPARSLEATLMPLLKSIPWYGLVEKFIGDCVLSNSTVKMLICTKLIFHKSFSNPQLLLQNIVGYLGQAPRRHLYIEMFLRLLSVWGSPTSMRHISQEQHVYMSRAIMVCLGSLEPKDVTGRREDFLRLLLPGVSSHLESSEPQLRLLAMTLAKRLTNVLDPSGPQLEFELDKHHAMVKDLLSYEGLPSDPGPSQEHLALLKQNTEFSKSATVETKLKSLKLEDNATNETSDLDSDDDLVPYDMTNDKKVSDVKPPRYVRECMEGLISSSENASRAELCLQHAEGLIRRRTCGLDEIAAEFAMILLHMQECGGMEGFTQHRRRALAALGVTCPVPVADYLTSQFYERNYNLRQRMDILEVLADAALELSQPETNKGQEKDKMIVELTKTPKEVDSWKDVVQRRIDSNTRRVASPSAPVPPTHLSRFSPVCGHFLYPLMARADHKEAHVDLLGQDSALLFRLLYTLALVVHAATHAPGVTQMGRTLLEFTWSLRMHHDQCVRQAVLMATTTVFLAVPTHAILGNLHADVSETTAWLEDVMERDADTECQKQAAQALIILQEQVKKGVEAEAR